MTLQARRPGSGSLLFDVDGVLTDGDVVMHADGSESKGFHIRDGAAIVWAQRAGLTVGLLSARSSGATAHRAAQLAIRIVAQGVGQQAVGLRTDRPGRQGRRSAVAYMGDDLLDLPVLARVGLSAAPADAAAEVRERVDWVSAVAGGRGAARELIEVVLRAQERWDDVLRQYFPRHSRDGELRRTPDRARRPARRAWRSARRWERYKLRDGQWIDRRRARESPHYMLGLNFLVANQTEPAIDELTRAAAAAGDPLEIHLILGNLYREKGQVGRAIQEHQKLLQRPESAEARARQRAAVPRPRLQARRLRRSRARGVHRSACASIPTISTRSRTWRSCTKNSTSGSEAYATRQKLARRDADTSQARHNEILAFLENELGLDALKRMDYAEAARRFEAAIELDRAQRAGLSESRRRALSTRATPLARLPRGSG